MSEEELIKVTQIHYGVQYAKYREQGHSRDMARIFACAFLEGFLESYTQKCLEKLLKEEIPCFLSMIEEVERKVGLRG